MKNNYLVIDKSVDPYYNLALEEYLLMNYTEGNLVMLWQNDNTIVVGRHQNTIEEINREYVEEHQIKVVRRTTGGGAVYHDLGNLNYSYITDYEEEDIDAGMKRFAEPVVSTLKDLGADARFSGRNDIVIGGRKVSGTAQRIYSSQGACNTVCPKGHKKRILHHGCLLFDADLTVVSQSLKVRAEKFQSKAVKSVRSRVGNIVDFLPEPVTLQEFENRLTETMLKGEEYQILNLSPEELKEVKKLRDEKYASWEWNYGQPMRCSIHNYCKYAGGVLEVCLEVKRGLIEACQIYGDFMALLPSEEAAGQLIGCRYRYEDVLLVLDKLTIADYFGTITEEEIASCICCKET